MLNKTALTTALLFVFGVVCTAQEKQESKPIELESLKAFVGVWDAEIEVWPQALDAPSIKFKGVEINRPYGEYWIASDFDSEYMGETMKVHSVIGYDLDQSKLVGTVIDHGAYAAGMTGHYDKETKTTHWNTKAKDATGNSIVQKTSVTQTNADERVLVLSVPGEKENQFTKFMEIRFVKRN